MITRSIAKVMTIQIAWPIKLGYLNDLQDLAKNRIITNKILDCSFVRIHVMHTSNVGALCGSD